MSGSADQPARPSSDTELVGRQLGDFQLLRRLGRGAMAEVYLAEQGSLRRRVAVKILKPQLANDPTYLKRFEREARAAASLVHANIVQIYEVGHVDQFHFIAQEYVQGQNLREWIGRNGPPDLRTALAILRQMAAALAKAAEAGVVHRDIKPENIMITAAGEVKVADFGLARLAGDEATGHLTEVGVTVGTPLYMSPEQAEGRPLDPRSDIYSLGATCYHLLSGTPPFVGETVLSIAVQHLKKPPQPLETLRPDLPPALCRIVHKMLAKDPQNRYASAREVLQDLHRLYLEHGRDWTDELPAWESALALTATTARVQLTEDLGRLMRSANLQRPTGRRWPWLVVGLGLSFAVGGLVAWLTVRENDPIARENREPSPVPKLENALQQWYYASEIGTEEAWQSVIDYFPEKEYLARRAKQQLARVYLRQGDYDRALALFRAFAALDDSDGEFRAFGLAGQCGVLCLKGQYRESAATADQLWPIRGKLKDTQMRKLVDYTVKKNGSKLGHQTTKPWDQWLEQQFRQEG